MQLTQVLWSATVASLAAFAAAVWVSSHLGDVTTLWAITATTAWVAGVGAGAFALSSALLALAKLLHRR